MSSLHDWETALDCLCIIMWVRQQFWPYKRRELIQRPNLEELQNNKETQLRTAPCSFRAENSSIHDVDSQQHSKSVIASWASLYAHINTHNGKLEVS